MATLTITPPSGAIYAKLTAIRVDVDEADVMDGVDPMRYRIRVTPPAGLEEETVSGYSHLFNVSSDGKHQWNGYIFPGDGSWTVRLHDEVEDSDVVSEAVTVLENPDEPEA